MPTLPHSMEVDLDADKLRTHISRYSGFGFLAVWSGILSVFRVPLLGIVGLSLLCLAFGLLNPLLLREILRGLHSDFEPPHWFIDFHHTIPSQLSWMSYPLLFSLLLTCSSILGIFATHHLFYVQPNFSFRVRAALNALLFEKSLRQDRSEQQSFTTGFIVNLIAVDTQKIQNLLVFFHSTWHHPLSLLCIILLLYSMIGSAALVGGSTLLVLLMASVAISRKQGKLRGELSSIADRRISLTRETLTHIKAAKLQGWEKRLEDKIQRLRESEVRIQRRLIQLSALLSFSSGSAPAIAMAITSICLVNQGIALDAALLFPVLALFMQLRFSLNILPETIYNAVEAHVATRRIWSFLISREFSPPDIDPRQLAAIHFQNVESYWTPGGAIATRVSNLLISRGELVVVVGSVGAGKSGLLLTILGELSSRIGRVTLGGSPIYVPQTPWIISDSIRNNILFGKPFEPELYQRALKCAGLQYDLAALPQGDNTHIGERGINLSGGQRHRVALARALYAEADIYLLDDPLSALDPHVANQVFAELICSELKTKTRILVSHRVEFALAADRILVVQDGSIVEDGTPAELKEKNGKFAALLNSHYSAAPIEHARRAHALLPLGGASDRFDLPNTLGLESEDVHSSIIEAEERRIGAVSFSTTRAYVSKLAPGPILAVIAALFLARQGAAVGTDLWLTSWADQPQLNIPLFISGYLCFILLLSLMGYCRTMYILSRGLSAGVDAHKNLLQGVLHAPLSFFESNPVGRILNRFSRDLDTIDLALPRSILDAGHCAIETIVVASIIVLVTPFTLLLIAPIAILYYALGVAFRPASRDIQRLTSISLSPIFSVASESLSGIESLRASALGFRCTSRFAAALNNHTRYNHIQTATNRWLGIRLETLGAMLIFAVGLAASLGWGLSVGVAFSGLALAYASSMTSSMNWAIRSIAMVENSLTSFERIERYSNTESEQRVGISAPVGWPTQGAVQIHQLSVRYRPHLPDALRDISCLIPPGSRVGIIGRTGSGKSTLILSLLRLLEPCHGKIEVDGIDLSTITLNDLRASIAVIPQEPILFSGTLRESLDPFDQYTNADILTALDRVGLQSFVLALPDGLNFIVREGGSNFSNGQRQLICLARALLRRCKLVILDEATASVDIVTDQSIQRAIREQMVGSTLLVIAHRIGTVLDSDYILGLHNGTLAEFGAPAALLGTPDSLLSRVINEMQSHRTQNTA